MSEISETKRTIEETEAPVQQDVKKAKVESTPVDATNVTEPDVGITHFLSPELPGFKGQIKQRYTDFMVNEIDKNNNVVHLTDKGFKVPKKPQPSRDEIRAKKEEEAEKRKEFVVEPKLRKEIVEIFGEADAAKIEEVYRHATKMESEKSFEDKSVRTSIHQLLRKAFNNELESVTTDTNTFKIARSTQNSRVNKKDLIEQTKDANGVENWGYGPSKEFLHFTLMKENKDTMDAVNIICKLLRMPTRVMRYAGTKDRRGVTCQRMCISKLGVDRINALNRTLKGMIVGNFSYEDNSLNLGDLKGNEFVIAIRDVVMNPKSALSLEETLENGCKSLTDNGFINYYGMQRFGTFSISTHTVGKELLAGNWENAAELILSDQENVLPKSKEARQIWAETKDASLALKKMPRQNIAENAILFFLSNQRKEEDGKYSANSYYSAIMKIPRNLRTMYVHAYQSYVWNTVASKRIELFGLTPIVGDLVIDNEANNKKVEDDDEDLKEDLREAEFIRAKALTQEDIDSGKYSMEDIVLPTSGFDVLYPNNEELKNIYVDLMKKDNMDPFDMRRKVRDFSMAGSYRQIIQKPKELEYKVIHYSEPTQQLVNTDLEILNNTRAMESGQKYMKAKLERYAPDKCGDKTAVVLKFQLGTSAYATMALRELMKLETSRRGDMCDVKV